MLITGLNDQGLCMNKGSHTSMHRSQWAEKIQNQGNFKD